MLVWDVTVGYAHGSKYSLIYLFVYCELFCTCKADWGISFYCSLHPLESPVFHHVQHGLSLTFVCLGLQLFAAADAVVWAFTVSSLPQCVTLFSFSYLNPYWITPI